jgi:hypothetical protein
MAQEEPVPGKRYLALIKCKWGIHNCLAFNYANACCDWNVLYYKGQGSWEFSTNEPVTRQEVIAWTDLPTIPKELMTYESK